MHIPVPVELEGAAKAIQMALQAQGDADFDFDLWLQKWLLMPQPALGGSRPADLLGTADGITSVRRALGSLVGGSYQ